MGLVSVMVWVVVEGGAGFYQADGLCCHPLGTGLSENWRWLGGGGGSVPATWRQLSVADPYEGGAVGRLVFPGCIGYSTV